MYNEKIRKILNTNTAKILIIIFAITLSLTMQFRVQLHNHFSVLYGDSYDATIVATILEHWLNVIKGLSNWSQLNYFHPYTNTLGQTDGYFIVGLIYSGVRLLSGYDPFLSSELSNIVLRGIGFLSFYFLARKCLSLNFTLAVLGAVLFVLSNNLTIHGQRLQLATVSLAPACILLLWYTYKAFNEVNPKKLIIYGSASGVLLGAWSITCFYITWFFIFYTSFFTVFAIILCYKNMPNIIIKIRKQIIPLLIVLVVTTCSFIPLLSVYLPKAQETGMRTYESALSNTIGIESVLQVGTENFMFGTIYNKIVRIFIPSYSPSGEYYNTGIAPILFILFIAGCFLVFRSSTRREINNVKFLQSLVLTTFTTWVITMNFYGYSLWYYMYQYFPGAQALNVISAFQLFLTIPVLAIALKYLSVFFDRTPLTIFLVLSFVLCLEELNNGYIQLVRNDELAKVNNITKPSENCETFFVTGWKNQDTITPMSSWINNHYAHNVRAMLIAELINIPTINGFASFNPPDWNMAYPNAPDYISRINSYAEKHNVKNLCHLSLEDKTWSNTW